MAGAGGWSRQQFHDLLEGFLHFVRMVIRRRFQHLRQERLDLRPAVVRYFLRVFLEVRVGDVAVRVRQLQFQYRRQLGELLLDGLVIFLQPRILRVLGIGGLPEQVAW